MVTSLGVTRAGDQENKIDGITSGELRLVVGKRQKRSQKYTYRRERKVVRQTQEMICSEEIVRSEPL